jgi:uncharacterized protein (TIGR02246 family)
MHSPRYESPEEAEDAFYRAFEAGDLLAMMGVWAENETIVCIHPSGSRLDGQDAISRSWKSIFDHSPGLEIRITDATRTREGGIAVHVVHEHIRLITAERHQPPMITTNVFRLTDKGWRMIVHHASPVPGSEFNPQAALH